MRDVALRLAPWLDLVPYRVHQHHLAGQLRMVDRVYVCRLTRSDLLLRTVSSYPRVLRRRDAFWHKRKLELLYVTQHPSLVDLSFDPSIPVGGSVLAWGISELLTLRTSNEPNLTTIHSRPLPRQERARRRGLHLGRLSARVLQRARVRPPVRLHRRALAAVLAALYVCVAGGFRAAD